jgi:hypothetical protein
MLRRHPAFHRLPVPQVLAGVAMAVLGQQGLARSYVGVNRTNSSAILIFCHPDGPGTIKRLVERSFSELWVIYELEETAMALTATMVASEILMCGVKAGIKQIPIVGEMAVHVVEGLQRRHEAMDNTAHLAEINTKLSRVELAMRDTVEREIQKILINLGRPSVPGPELTREMTELRQIYEQGWVPSLFEGLLRNSSHWQELRRNPRQYGRILGDRDPVDPENGMHLLIDKDTTRILELPAASLALLLSNQSVGVPAAELRTGQDIWAFPSSKDTHHNSIVSGDLTLGGNDQGTAVSNEVLFEGLVLYSYNSTAGKNYSRCMLIVTRDEGLTGELLDGVLLRLTMDDLYYADASYDEARLVEGISADFIYVVRLSLFDNYHFFRLKHRDWENLHGAINQIQGKPRVPRGIVE